MAKFEGRLRVSVSQEGGEPFFCEIGDLRGEVEKLLKDNGTNTEVRVEMYEPPKGQKSKDDGGAYEVANRFQVTVEAVRKALSDEES